ncbi:MAG: hypothetical protein AB8B72_12025 [Crocinitomicaceae bacterium]
MKIKNLLVAALSVVALVSCGEAEPTICSCTELSLEGFKEVGMDEDKMKAFEEKHKAELDQCEVLGDKINKEMADLTQAENDSMRKAYMDDCPAMEELEALIMEQMQNSYQNFDMEEGMEDALEGLDLEGLDENSAELMEQIEAAVGSEK